MKLPRLISLCLGLGLAGAALRAAPVDLVLAPGAAPRVVYGAEKLADALRTAGLAPAIVAAPAAGARAIVIGDLGQPAVRREAEAAKLGLQPGAPGPEGFALATCPDGGIVVAGGDDSGALYGCLELARRVHDAGGLPAELRFTDHPAFVLRGTCIGMQKTYILPGRHVYEYPYTPELFPFFYDKAFWTGYLDFLAANRMNMLCLWNGHPFASLVKLKDYPHALEVSEADYEKNVAMYRYLARECDRRGIWLVQMFYNIIVSKPFAERHGIPTQLSAPTPLVADYTRQSIAEFIRQYPHVGLMVCLGEALKGTANQVEWCTQVILPGVRDGMKEAGLTQEPPVILRTHATDAPAVIPPALKVYHNLYTMTKFNGEALTTWQPRGAWQQLNLEMSRLGSTHISNVHILANLEPFRYGDTRFIQKCVQAMRDRYGARGLHLYPLSYWHWPDAPDKTDPPLLQYRRDWIWFEAWARYAWNPDIPPAADRAFWTGELAARYGSRAAAADILAAYDNSGECAPRLLRRFGITDGNRQTLSLGMTLDELVHPEKYKPFPTLWESESPPGERLREYADREWNHQPHTGETPPEVIRAVLDFSQQAVAAIDAAAPLVTRDRAEFGRLRNDILCIRAMSQNYAAKAEAALCVLRYEHSRDVADLERAEKFLAASLDDYRTLVRLTQDTYLFANSMQTRQRRIPVPGGEHGHPANYRWDQLLPVYEKELADFQARVAAVKAGRAPAEAAAPAAFVPAAFTLLGGGETYAVAPGARVFTDEPFAIRALAPALRGLTGIRFSNRALQAGSAAPVEFSTTAPVRVLVGYVRSAAPGWRQPPTLETDANAGANGASLEPLLTGAATVGTLPAVDVYGIDFGPGRHTLAPDGAGSFLVLGVVQPPGAKGGR